MTIAIRGGTKSQNRLEINDDGSLNAQISSSTTGKVVSAVITRPNNTDAYTAGDVVSSTAGDASVFATGLSAGSMFVILGSRLRIDVGTVPVGCTGYNLHLYSAAPTVTPDNSAFDLPVADRPKYLGYIPISQPIDLGATIWSQDDNLNISGKLATGSSSLYGFLQTIGAYTPTANAIHTVTLELASL